MTEAVDLIYWQAHNLADFTRHFVGGNLTSNGVQYTSSVDTTAINTDVVVYSTTINSPIAEGCIFSVIEWEFNLTVELRAVTSGTANLIWKWQARNQGGATWTDLFAAVTELAPGAAYVSRTYSGYFPITNVNEIPMDLRLLLQCNELNEGRARVKNSSFVRAIMRVKDQ